MLITANEDVLQHSRAQGDPGLVDGVEPYEGSEPEDGVTEQANQAENPRLSAAAPVPHLRAQTYAWDGARPSAPTTHTTVGRNGTVRQNVQFEVPIQMDLSAITAAFDEFREVWRPISDAVLDVREQVRRLAAQFPAEALAVERGPIQFEPGTNLAPQIEVRL